MTDPLSRRCTFGCHACACRARVVRQPKCARRQGRVWHRELPPPDAEAIGEHTIGQPAPACGQPAYRDRLWDACMTTSCPRPEGAWNRK
jgi:hypothetical protein